MFLMEIYFTKYRFEELGWNTAFSNTLVLIFVSLDLVRYLYNTGGLVFGLHTVLVGTVIFLGIVLSLFNFFHILPEKLSFVMSSKFPINFLALISILIIYSGIVLNVPTLIAVLIFMFILYGLFKLIDSAFSPEGAKE